ncbi:MAG: hypothetical protein V3V03_05100 [Hyphomonadaceae bacterium]
MAKKEPAEEANLGQVVGLIAAIAAAIYGWKQAELSGQEPWIGGLIFGAAGYGLGRLGVAIVKSLIALAIYAVFIFVMMIVFRERMIGMFGVDPLAFLEQILNG